MSMSRAWSATIRFNRAFSRSSSFSRSMSGPFIPPYWACHRWNVASDTPSSLATSAALFPDAIATSAWRNFPTICSGVCRFRFIGDSLWPSRARSLSYQPDRLSGGRSHALGQRTDSTNLGWRVGRRLGAHAERWILRSPRGNRPVVDTAAAGGRLARSSTGGRLCSLGCSTDGTRGECASWERRERPPASRADAPAGRALEGMSGVEPSPAARAERRCVAANRLGVRGVRVARGAAVDGSKGGRRPPRGSLPGPRAREFASATRGSPGPLRRSRRPRSHGRER